MKPLVVLLLVLGALGALFFALTSITGARRGGTGDQPITTVKPVETVEDPSRLLDPVVRGEKTDTRVVAEGETLPEASASGDDRVDSGSIEGLVVDEEGQLVAEAHVDLLNARKTDFDDMLYAAKDLEPPRPVGKAVTDATGKFRFDDLDPRKDWTLVVTHERYKREDVSVKVPEGGVWKEQVLLYLGQTFSGVVRDALTADPIAGAKLLVDNPLAVGKKKSATRIEATTDATGVYSFVNVKGGQHVLTITAPGYATQVHNNFSLVELTEPGTKFTNRQPPARMTSKQQDFEMQPGKVIAGRVLGPDRVGLPGIDVEALNQAGTIGSTGTGTSAKNGEFLIEGLAEGLYTVRVIAQGYEAPPKQRVEAGETNLTIELFEQASVSGKVLTPDGRPLDSFTVKVRTANDVSNAFGQVLGQKAVKGSKDGSFEVRGIPEGPYVVEGIAPGYASSFSEPFNAVQGLVTSDVVVRMSTGGTLGGIVTDASGAPLAGVDVGTMDNNWIEGDFFELFAAFEPSALTKSKTRTDAEGRFQLELLTPGEYQVQIKAKDYSPIFVNDVKVVDGQHTDLPVQTLSRGALITGIVYGRDTRPSPGAVVQLTPVDPNQIYGSRTARTDATGRYKIENAQPGNYELGATRASTQSGNPFEVIGDLRQSKIEISVADAVDYEFDLHMGGARGN